MQQITSISNRAKQRFTFVLDNNETVDFLLYYLPRQQSWFFNFTYKDLTCNCLRVVLTPNALRQFKRIIPFGIAFISKSSVEPLNLNDFADGTINMYVLNSDEVKQIEAEIFNI